MKQEGSFFIALIIFTGGVGSTKVLLQGRITMVPPNLFFCFF